jgi:hypothetical protein|tara:strand:- start:258 stop:578 length:321 start_codon:yes stop_codon:yes gene_type:complete
MAQHEGLIIRTDGTTELRMIDGLSDMQEVVGGLIECACVVGGSDMWANEEGLMIGMQVNMKAAMLRAAVMGMTTYPIVGDVLLLGSTPEGESADVTQKTIDMVAAL